VSGDLCAAWRDWTIDRFGWESHAGGVVGDGAQVVWTRVGGGDAPSDAPLDNAVLQADIWGDKATISRAACAAMKDELRAALTEVGRQDVGDRTVLGATVLGERELPDPDTNRPRFVLTVSTPALVAA
jgi:hypothetical protein